MAAQRVALIGHSGAGKSASLVKLGIDRNSGDMDVVVGKECPSLVSALGWLANTDGVPVVVVSNHEQLLVELRQAKRAGRQTEQFTMIRFVYLHKPKDELRAHLAMRTTGGCNREPAGVKYTLDHYGRLHALFSELSDQTVQCAKKSVEVIAAEIQGIAQSLQV